MTAKIWPVMSKVVSCVEKLRALGTNKEEIVIIKALLLLNAGECEGGGDGWIGITH